MAKIVVTGGAGFIGSHIVEEYVRLGHDVIVVDNLATGRRENVGPGARFFELDVRSPELADLIRDERPEVISHHAAQTMVRVSAERPAYDADVNVLGMVNLLEAARAAGAGKLIFASSGGTVYGSCQRLPIRESEPFSPQSPYGISKVTGEHYIRFYSANYGLRYTILRYANVFGPRDTVSSEHVITVFVSRMLRGQSVTIHWDGEQAKDYVYVDDVVRANVLALDHGDGGAYNVGSGQPVSVNDIYRLLSDATGVHLPAEHGPQRLGDVRRFYFDCSAAARDLGWTPQVPFDQGLRATVAWYQSALVPAA